MSTVITADQYNSQTLSAGYSREIKDLIGEAVALGWELRIDSTGKPTIKSPTGIKTYHFTAGKQSGPLQRIMRDVLKYADPKLVAKRAKQQIKKPSPPPEPVKTPAILAQEAMFRKQQEEKVAAPAAVAAAGERTVVRTEEVKSGLHFVRRIWSDGAADYLCKHCGAVYDNRYQMAGHQKRHAFEARREQNGEAPKKSRQSSPVDTALEPEPEPERTTEAMNDAPVDAEKAEQDMSPTEVIAEIRALVNPPLLAELRRLEDENERLEDELTQVRGQLDKAQAKAVSYREKLQTFYDLVGGELKDEE